MRKICFLLPGYFEHTREKRYAGVKNILKQNDFVVVPVNTHWKYRTAAHWVDEFIETFNKTVKGDDKVCALGFSFGALVALSAADELRFDALLLCSLSPYFSEDLPGLKKFAQELGFDEEKIMGKRRMQDFTNRLFKNMTEKPSSKTYLLYGSEEPAIVERRAKDAYKRLSKTKLITVSGAEHDISDANYQKEIERVIKKL